MQYVYQSFSKSCCCSFRSKAFSFDLMKFYSLKSKGWRDKISFVKRKLFIFLSLIFFYSLFSCFQHFLHSYSLISYGKRTVQQSYTPYWHCVCIDGPRFAHLLLSFSFINTDIFYCSQELGKLILYQGSQSGPDLD